jgi:hypothetical protein
MTEEPTEQKTDKIANKIAARSALLDFYSDRAVAFGGFFLASVFGILTMLAIVQGIKCSDSNLTIVFVSLSFVPYLIFALIGYISLRQFVSYARIANQIEGGTGEAESLRFYAQLSEEIKDANKGFWVKNMKGMLSNARKFQFAYSFLIALLILVVYVPRFLSP